MLTLNHLTGFGVAIGAGAGAGGSPDGAQNPSTVSAVPIMTGNAAPSGVVTVSANYYGDVNAYELFDGASGTFYEWSPAAPQWAAYQFSTPRQINKVGIMVRQSWAKRGPGAFSVDASNDGTTWATLASYTGLTQGNWPDSAWTYFTFVNAVAYSRYRIAVSAGTPTTDGFLSLAGISLIAAA